MPAGLCPLVVPFTMLVYLPDEGRYEEVSKVRSGVRTVTISGTQVRDEYLNNGRKLSGSAGQRWRGSWQKHIRHGTSTVLLMEHGRQVTVLDGDMVRTHLSRGFGFSREDRDINIRRIGFVASEIVRHGGTVVCTAVGPCRAMRHYWTL